MNGAVCELSRPGGESWQGHVGIVQDMGLWDRPAADVLALGHGAGLEVLAAEMNTDRRSRIV